MHYTEPLLVSPSLLWSGKRSFADLHRLFSLHPPSWRIFQLGVAEGLCREDEFSHERKRMFRVGMVPSE